MKGFWSILVAALAGVAATQAVPFRNLDFEAANVRVIPHGQEGFPVPVSDGLPGWSVSVGTTSLTTVLHNTASLGSPQASILGPDYSYGIYGRIEGDFTALLDAGSAPSGPPLSIRQTGFLPTDSHWLFFKGVVPTGPNAGFAVSVNGQDIPVTVWERNADYSLYGGNISLFAGTEADLEFTVFRSGGNILRLDSIEFSPVPEPAPVALLALGLAGVGLRHQRQRLSRRAKG